MTDIGGRRLGLGLAWKALDPGRVAERVAEVVGSAVPVGAPIALGGLTLVLRASEPGTSDRLLIVTDLERPRASIPTGAVIGWATVDVERAQRDLVEAGIVASALTAEGTDLLLGAAVRRAASSVFGCPLLLLEPVTEGRLAATLARHGEGPCAIYLEHGAGAAVLAPVGTRTGPHLIIGGAEYHRGR